MTIEVGVITGVITGDLMLRTTWDGRQALFAVQYDGADEWYTVEGSPVPAPTVAEAEAAHRVIADAVRRGGAAARPPPPTSAAEARPVPSRAAGCPLRAGLSGSSGRPRSVARRSRVEQPARGGRAVLREADDQIHLVVRPG
ncbi:hypothetical protein [Kitasatospora sp. NPDC093102]|uniref:hypothetical protein n=1 Tax=Kitasatospora sp. NPDC093102 TaxID=3155069 RepID=UPI00344287D6